MLEAAIDRLTRISLRLRAIVIVLAVLALGAGALALTQLKQELIPPIEFPQSVVLAFNPDLDAEQMLDQVTIPLEETVRGVEGVVNVESNTSPGVSAVIARNEFGLDQAALRADIQSAVDGVDLPPEMDPPELIAFGLSDLPIAVVSVSSSQLSLEDLKSLVNDQIVPDLMQIPDVAEVQVTGGQELPDQAAQQAAAEPAAQASPEPTAAPEPTAQPEPAVEVSPPVGEPVALPQQWVDMAAAQGVNLETTDDLSAPMVAAAAQLAPQMFAELTPEMILAAPSEVIAAVPPAVVGTLSPDQQAAFAERGVTAEAAAGPVVEPTPQVDLSNAPALSGAWLLPPENDPTAEPMFQTAADLINNGFVPGAAQFLNLFVSSGNPTAPVLIPDLTPDVIAWLEQVEPGFLSNLDPGVLRLLSPEVLNQLPDSFWAGLEPDFRTELEAIAAGQLEVFTPTATINRVNGNPSLSLVIAQTSEGNTVSTTHAVFDELDQLEASHAGLSFDVVFEQATFIEESIQGVAREGGLGAVFAVIVILLFLSGIVNGKYRLSWRSTLVTGVSIPLSVFMAFAALRWLPPLADPLLGGLVDLTAGIPVLGAASTALHRLFPVGITLNIMTLSGMTVAVGRVVDDSIVVLENIFRHIQRGEDQRDSVLTGTRDVAIAILASTVTTVVVFLPIGLLGGLVGEFFLPFGVAVTYALASSFLVAVTVVPTLAFMFIRKQHVPAEAETSLQRRYTPILRWVLGHRGATIAIAALLFAGSMLLLSQRPRAFIPNLGEVRISATVTLPEGTDIIETDDLVRQFEQRLQGIAGIETVSSEVGTGGGLQDLLLGTGVDQRAASISIRLENPEDADQLTGAIRSAAEQVFGADNVIVSSGTASASAFGGFALVAAGDPQELADFNDQALATLNQVEGLTNVSSNLGETENILRVDGESAVRYSGELQSADTLGVTEAAKAELQAIAPAGITVSEGFETQQQTQGFAQAIRSVAISILAVYLVMVITFRSFVHPFTILFSLPMAVIGAAVALWLTDRVVGIPVLVGMMMLVGIVVTNAIVLIDRVQANRKRRGMDAREALIEGGRTRLRPILMTAIAAMLALVPLALGLTEGAIIAAELATVVIGGLFSSTFLTLLIVPVMYSLLDRLSASRGPQAAKS